MFINPSTNMLGAPRLNAILSAMSESAEESHADSALRKRQYGYPYGYRYGYSGWGSYGRWILLGVIVGLAVLVWLMVCLCNRRRTRAGSKPVKYTGWATPGFQHPQQSGVTTNQNYNTQPQPYANQTTQYPMQNYSQTQYPQTNTTYPQGQTYGNNNSSIPSEYNNYNGAIGGNEYSQPPSYPAAPAAVVGREK